MKTERKVWFGRARAAFWALLGLVSIPLGWSSSVALVWAASVYANVESGFATSEAADDRAVRGEVRELRAELRELKAMLSEVRAMLDAR